MNEAMRQHPWQSKDGVEEDLQRLPHLFFRLAENALLVSESLRSNYFANTATFVHQLCRRMKSDDPILYHTSVDGLGWDDVRGEVVTFIDGGVGQVQISSQVPILLRVGSYCVRTGERQISEREKFGYYPVILGDLEGGSRERKDFIDIVRITAELLGGLSALQRTLDLSMLMFHGPLVYNVGLYQEHAPFTEHDIDLFLGQYAADPGQARAIKEEFLHSARLDIYPAMTTRSDEWVDRRVFEPLSFMAFLYRKLIETARQRSPVPVIAGVVERGSMTQFCREILLERVFRGLREKGHSNYFNDLFGRTDLTGPKALIDRLGYTDGLLLGMLLQPGQATEAWKINKYDAFRRGDLMLPGESFATPVDWKALQPPSPFGFPEVSGCYVAVSETTEPVRVEVLSDLGADQIVRAAQRAYLYARLLPGYGFPVGLDIADKYAKVPNWLTDAYGKMIRHNLGVSLQQGEISDAEMRRILVQAIYITHRDWLFRPEA